MGNFHRNFHGRAQSLATVPTRSLEAAAATLTHSPRRCQPHAVPNHRWMKPRLLAAMMCVLASLGCRPQARLGDGPPTITDKTKVLAQFDPAALAEPSATGFQPGAAEAGPPQ